MNETCSFDVVTHTRTKLQKPKCQIKSCPHFNFLTSNSSERMPTQTLRLACYSKYRNFDHGLECGCERQKTGGMGTLNERKKFQVTVQSCSVSTENLLLGSCVGRWIVCVCMYVCTGNGVIILCLAWRYHLMLPNVSTCLEANLFGQNNSNYFLCSFWQPPPPPQQQPTINKFLTDEEDACSINCKVNAVKVNAMEIYFRFCIVCCRVSVKQ